MENILLVAFEFPFRRLFVWYIPMVWLPLFSICVKLEAALECHVFALHFFHRSTVDTLTALSDTLISFDTSPNRYWLKQIKATETSLKKKYNYHGINMLELPALIRHAIISFYFLSSSVDDEPALAEEEGVSADSHTEDRYKTNNFLIHVIAGLARKQIMANCHCVLFRVITKPSTS